MRSGTEPEGWAKIGERVIRRRAQELGRAREKIYCNAQMSSRPIRTFCELSTDCERFVEHAITEQGLSARAHDRVLKVARTVADIEETAIIEPNIAEAIEYRAWTGHTGRKPRQLASRAQTHPGKAK